MKFTPDGGARRACERAADGTTLAVTVTDTGVGHRRRGPRAHLRVLPAGRPGARRRPRAPAWASRCRSASSSCTVAGSGSRARSASAAPSASPSRCRPTRRSADADDRAPGHRPARPRPRSSSSRTTGARSSCSTLYLRWRGRRRRRGAATARKGSSSSAGCTRRRSCSTSACRSSTAGTCSRCSRPTQRPPRDPGDRRLDGRRARQGLRARCRRLSRQAGGPRRRGLRRPAPGRWRCPSRGGRVVAIDDDPMALELVRAVLEPRGLDRSCGAAAGEDGVALSAVEPARRSSCVDLLMPGHGRLRRRGRGCGADPDDGDDPDRRPDRQRR